MLKRESSAKGDTNRAFITDLQLENSRLKFQLDTTAEMFDVGKLQLTDARSNELKQKHETENQLKRLRENIAETDERVRIRNVKTSYLANQIGTLININ